MSKVIYGVIAILIIAVAVLSGLVGYLYWQKPQTVTETNSQTITVTNTSTYTQIVSDTSTHIYPASTPEPFELLEISSAYANSSTEVIMNVWNPGSLDATITDIFVNGIPLPLFMSCNVTGTVFPDLPLLLIKNSHIIFVITFSSLGLTSGATFNFKIHTASGKDYTKAVVIP